MRNIETNNKETIYSGNKETEKIADRETIESNVEEHKKVSSIFTQENIYQSLIHFAVPGVITILMAELYNMVDTFFVGRYAGSEAIGAMGIAFPVQRLIIALSLMIGVGTATAVSRALGEKNPDKMRENIGASITLGLFVLSLVPIVLYLFPQSILTLLGARGEIYFQSKAYLDIVVLGSLFLGFTNIFGYELTALGHPKITLIATSIGTLINVAVDYVLVGIFDMGVQGAALATVLSQLIAFLFTLSNINYYRRIHKFTLKPKIDSPIMRNILAIGFATFIVEISDAVLIASLNNILLSIGGNEAVIIVGAITRVSMFMYITIIGIGSGMQPLAAYSYGARDFDRLKKIVRATSRLVLGSSILLWGLIMIFTEAIIGSFMKDPELLTKTVSIFRFTIVIFPIIAMYYVCIYYCQSIGQATLSFFLSIYRQLLLFIPIVILLTRWLGMKGAWLTYPVTDAIAAVTGLYFMKRSMRGLEER